MFHRAASLSPYTSLFHLFKNTDMDKTGADRKKDMAV